MNDPWAPSIADVQARIAGKQRVNQGPFTVAAGWVNNHARRLVYSQQVIILVDHLEGNGLRDDFFGGSGRNSHHHAHSGFHGDAWLRHLTIQSHQTLPDQTLCPRTRHIRQGACQKAI